MLRTATEYRLGYATRGNKFLTDGSFEQPRCKMPTLLWIGNGAQAKYTPTTGDRQFKTTTLVAMTIRNVP